MAGICESQGSAVVDWLEGISGLATDAAEWPQPCTAVAELTPPSPPSLKEEQQHHHHHQFPYGPFELWSMEPLSEDTVSTSTSFSASTLDIRNRPILRPKRPKSPSKKADRSRTPSPTRKLFGLLGQANPPIRCCQPGTSGIEQPEAVTELRSFLTKDIRVGAAPAQLKVGGTSAFALSLSWRANAENTIGSPPRG